MNKTLIALLLGSSTALSAQPPAAGGPPRPAFRGTVFLSPMGEPFRSGEAGEDNVGAWFDAADTNHDGALVLAEMEADAARFFSRLDTDRDNELGPEEISNYETAIAPEVQLGMQMRASGFGGRGDGRRWGGGRRGGGDGRGDRRTGGRPAGRAFGGEFDPGLEGAGRFSFLNIPEPVISADADLNRGVSRAEFVKAAGQRFVMLDKDRDGRITRAELPPLPERHAGKRKGKAPPHPREGIPLPDGD
jgi:hypothetical protein